MKLWSGQFVISAGLLMSAEAASAITTIETSAYAVYSDIRAASIAAVVVGPIAPAAGIASPGFDVDNSVVSLGTDVDLGTLAGVRTGLSLDTGVLTSNATANGVAPGDTTAGSASSTINDVLVSLFTQIGFLPAIDFLGLSADTITSTTTVARSGNTSILTGQSVYENLDLAVGSGLLNFSLGANAEVLPNTTLLDLGGITILLNEQFVGGNGTTDKSLTTNAFHVILNDYLLGGRLLDGEFIIGHSFARMRIDPDPDPQGVPEPGVWLQLIAGFGLAGGVVRGRRRAAA